jgi:hypothetical protein
MRFTIAILAALLVGTGALAQDRGAYYGPFTDAEAQLLSAVWPEIREAANYEDINWANLGIARPPGNRDVQRAMSANWAELRRAPRFEQIDWDRLVAESGSRSSRYDQTDRFERQFPGRSSTYYGAGPFTREEADILSQVWPDIREAASFSDIDWRAYGLSRAPGSSDARRAMAANWNELRRESRFEDIDWDAIADDPRRANRQYAGGFGSSSASPFTTDEAAVMSRVWGQIREAGNFNDINWRAAGLSGPPGNREARRIMATHWGQLREAARFEDIDWASTTGSRTRVLR